MANGEPETRDSDTETLRSEIAALTTRQRVRNRLLAVLAAVAIVVALRYGYPVLMPVAVGGFIIAAAWPVRNWFHDRMPPWASYTCTMLTLVLAMGGFFAVIYFALAQVVQTFYDQQDELRGVYQAYLRVAQDLGLPTPTGSGAGEEAGSGFDRLVAIGRMLVAQIYAVLSYLGVVALIVAMGFPQVPQMAKKVRHQFRLNERREISDTIGKIAEDFRSYISMTVLTSLITGLVSALWSYSVGLDLGTIWGVLNFLLNFVPVVGNIIGILPPTLYAFVQFGGWTMPLVVFLGFTILQLIISNVVYPMLQGRGLSMPPITIVVSLLFWGWIWGFAGALFAVPLTAVVIEVARQFESTRRYALVFGRSEEESREEAENARQTDDSNGEDTGKRAD